MFGKRDYVAIRRKLATRVCLKFIGKGFFNQIRHLIMFPDGNFIGFIDRLDSMLDFTTEKFSSLFLIVLAWKIRSRIIIFKEFSKKKKVPAVSLNWG